MTQTGACAHCGAPHWSPTIWHGTTPPPSTPSCACFPARRHWTATSLAQAALAPPQR